MSGCLHLHLQWKCVINLMARVVALDEVNHTLKQYLINTLRAQDEAVVLPQSHLSPESGAVKNVVMRLDGSCDGLDPKVFSPDWFSGVSVVHVPSAAAEALLSSNEKRKCVVQALAQAIPSEMQDSQVQVGPELDGDAEDRDTSPWTAGFDGPGCCVGLYSATQNRAPDARMDGMSRAHLSYYLVCKAGAGIAGQTFHSRLSSSLKKGQTLDEALSDSGYPGSRALRRVTMAGRRNRCRVLTAAAQSMGFLTLDTIGDNASPTTSPYRIAIPAIDCSYNSITQVEAGARKVWQYCSGCTDGALSKGRVCSSNVSEGFVAFMNPNGDMKFSCRNEAHGALPFSTPRIASNRDVVFRETEAYKQAKARSTAVHPDHEWISTHFAWSSKNFGNGVDMEPTSLWGSHESEQFVAEWSRELGVAKAQPVRLQPQLVALSAMEPNRLRVASKAVSEA